MRVWGLILVDHPWTALAIAVFFALLWTLRARKQSRSLAVTAALPTLAWLAYAAYEWRMSIWSATVVAPIRVDLLIAIPVLLGITLLGAVAMAGSGTA
jgi:hypothetical protein